MGIRDWLKKGVLAVGLTSIITNNSCNTPSYSWRFLDVEKISTEKSEKTRLEYEITEGSFVLKRKDLGLLKASVIEKRIKEHYESSVIVKKFGKYQEESFIGETKQVIEITKPKKVNEDIKTKPASSIPLFFWDDNLYFNANKDVLKTNEDGTIKTEVKIVSYEEDGVFFGKEYIKDFDWEYIKEPAESIIEDYLIRNYVKIEDCEIWLGTRVPEAKDDNKRLGMITMWRVKDRDSSLEKAVKQFVKEEINSKIKKVTLSLLDYDSHTPITLTKDVEESYIPGNIILESTKGPAKEDLIGQYFEGKFSEPALATLKDYITTKSKISTDTEKGEVSFYVYLPSTFKVKITHPKYHHVSDQELSFSEKSLDKEVYMSKLGKKVDLKIVDKDPKPKIKDKE